MIVFRRNIFMCLVAAFFVILGLVLPIIMDNAPAMAEGFAWTDTRGPGNGSANSLLYVPARNELYRWTARGVWRYSPATGTWTDTGGGLSNAYITSLAWDGSGLYAGTYWHGVWHYDPGTGMWSETGGDFSRCPVYSLAWDGSRLYAGTFIDGVLRYNPATGAWTNIVGAGYNIESLAWDGSVLYCGTSYPGGGDGVWRYDPGTGNWTDTGGGVSTYVIYSLAWDGSGLYAGASSSTTTQGYGVWHYAPSTGIWKNTGGNLSNVTIRSLSFGDSILYAGTQNQGVWRYGSQTWYLAEGSTDGGMETWVLVQNPNPDPVTVNLALMTESGEQRPGGLQNQVIGGNSRTSFPIHSFVKTFNVSTKVEASGNVICERAMYGPGRNWAHDSVGFAP